MTGGANDYKLMAPNLNIFQTPNNLGAVRSSDSWPPKKFSHLFKIKYMVTSRHCISNIWNKTAAIVD